jgi:hypothetical protein
MDLSKSGRRRAEKLAKYIPQTFGKPDYLFAASPVADSVRAYLTLRPLADASGLVIDGSYKSTEFVYLSSKLLHDPRFDDSRIVVAWTHKELPTLGSALGAPRDALPKQWEDNVFDLCFALTYKKSASPKVRRLKQPF